jgi:quinone-modifying oxidoreductase subunit QmoC
MSIRVDPSLRSELHQYGAVDIDACYNCGNCTAICALSEAQIPLPRKTIRYLQLGAKDRLVESLEPWLCYYCGECTQTCPREADPGEAMMAMRRYLTAQYDWTGLGQRFYRSKVWEFAALLLVAVLVIVGFCLFHGPMVTERVELLTFAPAKRIEVVDWAIALLLGGLILSNVYRMYARVMRSGPRLSGRPLLYLRELKTLILHFLTQARYLQCKNRRHWLNHFLLMTGYSLMFLLVVILLRWFQTDRIYPIYHPQRLLGYYAFLGLTYGSTVALIGRLRKREPIHVHSHTTDWLFLVLLLVTSVTGLAVHVLRYLEMPLPTYYMYVAHLAIGIPMLVVEVPFSKWAHLSYRPVAMYLAAVRARATELEAQPSAQAQVA